MNDSAPGISFEGGKPLTPQQTIVSWALQQQGNPYLWGGTGRPCSPGLRRELINQYPQQQQNITRHCPVLRGERSDCGSCPHRGKPCYDCAQLTRRALGMASISLPSGASSQWRASAWAYKGPLDEQAGNTLCLLFRQGSDAQRPMQHVGLSLGDGHTVDARGYARGVVVGQIRDYPWTHYAVPHALLDKQEELIRPGDRGEAVRHLQQLLMGAGFPLPRYGADGIFGQETLQALHAFMDSAGLPPADHASRTLLLKLQEAGRYRTKTLEQRVDALEEAVFPAGGAS